MAFSRGLVSISFATASRTWVIEAYLKTLTDLNDFITPSQACIKPVEEVKPKQVENAASVSLYSK